MGETHRPRRLKFALLGFAMTMLGLGAIASGHHDALTWGSAGACLGAAAFLFASVVAGFPRLRVTADGVELRTLFGAQRATWASLAPFALTTLSTGVLGQKVRMAQAAVIDGGAARRKPFTINDAFHTPIDTIIADLNARRLLALGPTAPVVAQPISVEGPAVGVAGFTQPWLSFAIVAVLVAGFAAEHLLAIGPSSGLLKPHITTLLALGGLNGNLVAQHGEWYRLFTAPLLHGDLAHLAFNGIALVMVGHLLEPLVGRWWFAASYGVGALGGAVGSVVINLPALTSVGASGAIMGAFATALAVSFRLPKGSAARSTVQGAALRVLIPSMLPLATAGTIDYAAHGGGALAGAALGFALIPLWRAGAPLPGWRPLAAVLAITGALAAVVGVGLVAQNYPRYQKLTGLMPQAELPKSDADGRARSAELVARWPDDPRIRFHRAMALVQARDLAGGERELRLAVSQAEAVRFYLGGQLASSIRGILAAVQLDLGNPATARETARPACEAVGDDRPTEQIRALLDRAKLCD